MIDSSYARVVERDSVRIYADRLTAVEWRELQESYRIGELLMPCCDAAAVPKTSPLGLQFFAHASGQCGAAPESIWHERGKQAVADTARGLGYQAIIEHPGPGWQADVWLNTPAGAVVDEVQHSYQHLRDYERRHARYAKNDLRCLWLVIEKCYGTLQMSCCRQRQRTDLKGLSRWPSGDGGLLPSFPAALLDLDEKALARGPGLYTDLPTLIRAFVEGRLLWNTGCWTIDGVPTLPPRNADLKG